jgi:enoyl-CoA hydratase/carnithine racemase
MSTLVADPIATQVLVREDEGAIVTLTLNRPEHFNALSGELLGALQSALDDIARDRAVRVVIIAARGKGFCAGHDLREIKALATKPAIEALFLECSRMMMTLARLPVPVIAAVHGIATAAGCQLVASCDLAVASSSARFATPGVNIGAFCATPSVALGRAVQRKHAMEMLLTGEMISAERAREIGLVNTVVAPDALPGEVRRLAGLLAGKSRQALATGKRMFYDQLELGIDDAYALASSAIAADLASPEGREGVDAFLDKRAPHWPD